MRLLTSTDFALRVLMRLAATPEAHLSTDALARELVISRNHLHKIVQYLTEAGLVRTIRGARGGVMLARPAGEIKVGEVIRNHEQDQALVECFRADGGACTLLPRCRLRSMLDTAKTVFYRHLDQYTLADCLAGPRLPSHAPPRPKHRQASRSTLEKRLPRSKYSERR
jgi:Rrf2 family transcriptional regulator, nitric oxide-sensitive transcriptional repressor